MTTYAQLKEDGSRITWQEFQMEVANVMKKYILIKLTSKHVKLCRKLYNKGYSIKDTISFLILNS